MGSPSDSNATAASFSWRTAGEVTGTTCSLDGGPAEPCSSPKSYDGLALGTHTFRVTVSGSGGSASAEHAWSVLASYVQQQAAAGPTVTFLTVPELSSSAPTASFAWTTTGVVATVSCSLDAGPAESCGSRSSFYGLGVGLHTFVVTVSGGGRSSSATYSWYVSYAG